MPGPLRINLKRQSELACARIIMILEEDVVNLSVARIWGQVIRALLLNSENVHSPTKA